MKKIIISVFAICLAFAATGFVSAQQSVPLTFEVIGASMVTVEGEEVELLSQLDTENLAAYVFSEGGFLRLRHRLSRIVYTVTSAQDLSNFLTAYANKTNGESVGRWVLGGNRQRIDYSTISSTNRIVPSVVPNGVPAVTPSAAAATPTSP